ncbi:hypothetical protein J6590_078965 [Homalodisca vitripennis]|nr:hypothetical protein J6590_078965 [Homalodisca vitripennis]
MDNNNILDDELEEEDNVLEDEQEETEPKSQSALLSVVRQVREGVWAVSDQFNQVSSQFNNIVETGKAHTSSTIQILREEDNYPQRYGAIAAGGLLGYVIAIRRGWFRRIIYTGTGATAVAAICYPEEAKEYSSEGFKQAKRYIVIAYHFLNGVMRDYIGVQLPSLPGPLSSADTSVPTSASLMPPPATAPSHISAGPIPLPPIDLPTSVSASQKTQGSASSGKASKKNQQDTKPEPQPTSYSLPDPGHPVVFVLFLPV